ncbi:DUF6482 family protein [Salinicola acroporae]|uniref:Uncharacterized protein n=1 Tax=Salinicola acroporae TaxID=1541440 RepID=A0ABT6I4T5_9GAMM|nr:DUF6482 family protein [Salinicola acroporae]MDH4572704.1 hypothetical protein [Salinicola acroporae]
MKFSKFVQLARDGQISELHIESVAPQSFRFRAVAEGYTVALRDEQGNQISDRSLGHAKQRLRNVRGLEKLPLYLVQQRSGSIMVGNKAYSTSHKTPLTLDTSPLSAAIGVVGEPVGMGGSQAAL